MRTNALLQRRVKSTSMAVVVLVSVLLAGCAEDDYPLRDDSRDDMSLQQQFDELMQRPNMDEAKDRYRRMLQEVFQALTGQLSLPSFQEGSGGRENGCNEFDKVDSWDAVTAIMNDWGSSAKIPDGQWSHAIEIVKRSVAHYGFTKIGLEVDKPPVREFNLHDEYGAKLTLMSHDDPVGTLIGINTGCHLLPDVKQRGTPRNTPSSTTPY